MRRFATVAGATAGAIGIVVLFGWYAQLPALLRVHPSFVAMQYVTALAFVLAGSAVMMAARGMRRASAACAAAAGVLSATTLARYLGFGAPSVDQMLWHLGVSRAMEAYTAVKTSAPGRMAPNTALAFTLAAWAILWSAWRPRSRAAATGASLLGILVAGIALIALLGYFGGAPSAYGWGNLTRMAMPTAVAMLAVGVGVTALAAAGLDAAGISFTQRLPSLVVTGGCVVALGLWQAAADHEHQSVESEIQATARRLHDAVVAQTQSRLLALERMQKRWDFRGATSHAAAARVAWEYEAGLNLTHFQVYRALAWVGPSLTVRWVATVDHRAPSDSAQLVSFAALDQLNRARARRDVVVLEERGDGAEPALIAAAPLHPEGRFDGFIVGVIPVRQLLETALSDSLSRGYAVTAFSGGLPIYSTAAPGDPTGRFAEVGVTLRDVRWRLRVSPNRATLASLRSKLPGLVLAVGLLVTGLLGWVLRLLHVARARELEQLAANERIKDAAVQRERAAELTAINEQLMREMAEREHAEREHRRVEAQLIQSQKMEAVGQLAGGVAHDFNNVLTAIKSYSELLLDDLDPDDQRRADVSEISTAADRAATLTRQLLAFSRQQILQPQVLDLNAAVRNLEKMLRRLIPANITLVASLEPELGAVMADLGQLEQVLVNLVVNARDAMPDGGVLTIETANADLDEGYAQVRPHAEIAPGAYVLLAVSDTGCGMDEQIQARVFEPFFTTKEKGKGTGLGLSTVYGIVKQSGGYIGVYSEVGRGTTFKIHLPRVEAESGLRSPPQARLQPATGSETILLVEDDAAVRGVAHRVLERAGYRVIQANDGADALRLCENSALRLDLVVTDLVMPGIGGIELRQRLLETRPETNILLTSGYTADATFRRSLLEPGVPFLEKPYTPQALLSKVRDVLDGASDAARAPSAERSLPNTLDRRRSPIKQ